MSKFLTFFILGLFVLGLSFSNVKADEFGDNSQYYRVVFDGEREAAVYAKISFVNLSKTAISELPLEIPGNNPRILSIIQEKTDLTRYCIQYESSIGNIYTPSPIPSQSARPCLRWQEASTGQKTYSLIERDQSKDQKNDNSLKITLKLNQAVESTKSGTVILSYKAKGFTSDTWDGFTYKFQTIKSNFDFANTRVAIDATSDLYLKGEAEGGVEYKENTPTLSALDSGSFKAMQSAENYSNMIANSAGVVKETTALDPDESFTVDGKIYTHNWQANLTTYVLIGVTFLLLFGVLIYIIRAEKK